MNPAIGTALDITRDWAASLPEPLTHDQFQRMNDLQEWISAAIAAAVLQEREACAIAAHRVISDYFDLADTRRAKLADKVTAAIRARGEGRK